jgi:predicted AAA+ superfamily ATPase
VDFIWQRGKKAVGIEVKAASAWRKEQTQQLRFLLEQKAIEAGYLVYLGEEVLQDGPVPVLPLREFIKRLQKGRIIGWA